MNKITVLWDKLQLQRKIKESRQNLYLPHAAILEEGYGTQLVTTSIVIMTVIVLLLLIWAAVTDIDEITHTTGEIIPRDKEYAIEHLEGGMVRKIHVHDGQHVKAGTKLITMASSQAKSELAKARAKEIALLIDISRVKAYLESKNLNLTDIKGKLLARADLSKDIKNKVLHLIENDKSLLMSQVIISESKKESIITQIKNDRERVKNLEEQKASLQGQLKLLEQEKGMYKELIEKKYVSKRDYLRIQRDIKRQESELVKVQGEINHVRGVLNDHLLKLTQLNAEFREKAQKELVNLSHDLMQTQKSIENLHDRNKRLVIYAPVEGMVKGLDIHVGSVIPPGGKLMEFIPMEGEMVAQVQISPTDIGHIHVGDPVKLKVMTYDFARYGAINAELIHISASTFPGKNGKESYYRGIIKLTRQYVGNNPLTHQVKPGMTVQADIITGEKTLLSYMLKPIHTNLHAAFHER